MMTKERIAAAVDRTPEVKPVLARLAKRAASGKALPETFSASGLSYVAQRELEGTLGVVGKRTADGRVSFPLSDGLRDPPAWCEALEYFGIDLHEASIDDNEDVFERLKLLVPECGGKKLRPIKPIAGLNLAKYDIIFIGTPNWWGTMAPPVRTWATQSKDALKGKTVCLFQTHGGGGMQRVGKDFAETIGDAVKVLPPKAFSGSSIKSSVPALEAFASERLAAK